MKLIQIPCFYKNYIWILIWKNFSIVIDPSNERKVIDVLGNNFDHIFIFVTHNHIDHISGIYGLSKNYSNIVVYGPKEVHHVLHNINIVSEGDIIRIDKISFKVISVPGHTKGHVAYYSDPYLFCGDSLFSGGCGKIFEGTYEEMLSSIIKLSSLPNKTLVCCAHEYTLENIIFARHLLPNDKDIIDYFYVLQKKRRLGIPSLPSTIQNERKINVFLRLNDFKKKFKFFGKNSNLSIFSKIRRMKDEFICD
ncbi:hypothetical protein AOQ88_00695 [Candidatus Riesia sp. GBBU]|nr:hypothetical protein AOQ88_00695 [Candidatus Riesia sp. GBBU]